MNAYSSHAQTAAGGFILARACTDARAPLASGAYGLTMLLMGLVSFASWGSRRRAVQQVDSWLMETVTGASAAAYLAIGAPEYEPSCASSGRAWRLSAVQHSQREKPGH